jgi:hypothetical protein
MILPQLIADRCCWLAREAVNAPHCCRLELIDVPTIHEGPLTEPIMKVGLNPQERHLVFAHTDREFSFFVVIDNLLVPDRPQFCPASAGSGESVLPLR